MTIGGYTGPVIRGRALRHLGQSQVDLDEVTCLCPECKRPARLERFTLNGEPAAQVICSTWRTSRRKTLTQGCRPQRLSRDEMEKLEMKAKEGSKYLSDQQEKELVAMMKAAGLNATQFAAACGWQRTRIHDIIRRRLRLTPDAWAHMGSVCAQKVAEREAIEAIKNSAKEQAAKPPEAEKPQDEPVKVKEVWIGGTGNGPSFLDQLRTDVDALQATQGQQCERLNGLQEQIRKSLGVSTVAINMLKETFMEYRERNDAQVSAQVSALGARLDSRIDLFESQLEDQIEMIRTLGKRSEDQFATEGEATETQATDPDLLITSFVNFERICAKMRAKCPHLFAATVRRACQGAY